MKISGRRTFHVGGGWLQKSEIRMCQTYWRRREITWLGSNERLQEKRVTSRERRTLGTRKRQVSSARPRNFILRVIGEAIEGGRDDGQEQRSRHQLRGQQQWFRREKVVEDRGQIWRSRRSRARAQG